LKALIIGSAIKSISFNSRLFPNIILSFAEKEEEGINMAETP
jgi:hypothetical protein